MSANEWHGAKREELEAKSTNAPGMPEDFRADMLSAGAGDGTYARVVISGNFGFPGCTQYQQHTYFNITDDQIRQIGWTLFGLCPGWTAQRFTS